MISPLRELGFINRWNLTIYLDNGRPLRSYGTQPASVNYTFDFRELLIDRVVFQPGTLGTEVELYANYNWEGGFCYRNIACDTRFNEPMRIRSYKVLRR